MKHLPLLLLLLIGCFIYSGTLHAQCTGVRPDINSLTPAQQKSYREAIMAFLTDGVNQADPDVDDPEDYPQVEHHSAHAGEVHFTGTSKFTKWHRYYLQTMENWFLEHGFDEFVPLPAWNPSTPIPAEFFVPDAVLPAVDGFDMIEHDVISGFDFGDLTGSNKCGLFSDEDSFSAALEDQHNTVHGEVGGTMGFVNTSPGAAIFWPWHAWVDDAWYCYQNDCMSAASDLYVRDDENDTGVEPSNTLINWISPDIWVRQTNDGFANQQSQTLQQTPGAVAYVYVRIWNRGTGRHPNNKGNLDVYWANASAGLSWPSPWDGVPIPGLCVPPNANLPLGGFVGTQPLRSINEDFVDFTHSDEVRKDYTIYEFAWLLPDPDKYKSCFNDDEWQHRHFCILARIEGDDNDPIVDNGNFRDLLDFNNDVALKNITIFGDGQMIPPGVHVTLTECLFYGDYTDQAMNNVKLKLKFPTIKDQQLLQKAEIRMKPDAATLQEWTMNGFQGTNLSFEPPTGRIRLTGDNAELRGINLNPREIHRFCLEIMPTQEIDRPYMFDIIQYNGTQIINGERYVIGGTDATLNRNEEIIEKIPYAPFMVYPNPANDKFFVTWENTEDPHMLLLMNGMGQVVHQTNVKGGFAEIDVNSLPAGLYFTQLINMNTQERQVQKVLVEH